jgi:dihydroorotate dehydrogenase electron transfer subunit
MSLNTEHYNNNHKLRIRRIDRITDETPSIKTFWFEDNMHAIGGQFVMVWVPGVDEIPMSVSYTGAHKGITVAKVGDATAKLHELPVGSKLGIRGPYGNGFDISGAKHILAVAGGCGSAPIGPVLDESVNQNKDILFVVGARTNNELLFKNRALELGLEVEISTDDGSEGHHGFVTERIAELLADKKYDLILTCGPEQMLKKIVEVAVKNEIQIQVSLERYMKCGIGICDSCTIDGYQVCRDGPVFDGEMITQFAEFGNARRDPCGRLIDI